MAFMWANLSVRYIGMTEYRTSMILDFNQSYSLKNGSGGRIAEWIMIMEVFKHIQYETKHFTGFAGAYVSFIKNFHFCF